MYEEIPSMALALVTAISLCLPVFAEEPAKTGEVQK